MMNSESDRGGVRLATAESSNSTDGGGASSAGIAMGGGAGAGEGTGTETGTGVGVGTGVRRNRLGVRIGGRGAAYSVDGSSERGACAPGERKGLDHGSDQEHAL